MPLKQEVLPHHKYGPAESRIGACNTLRTGGRQALRLQYGCAGVVRPLEKRIRLKGARIAYWRREAGRAAVLGWSSRGRGFVVNRTHDKAVALARQPRQVAEA